MKENQEISLKKVEYWFQDSINNFGSLSMVDEGEKVGKKENQQLSREYQYQDCIENSRYLSMVDGGDRDFFIESEKLSSREKLKRHWTKVGGRVFVPDRWGHEGSLREWKDCSSFDTILAPKGLKSAREALMFQEKRARSGSTSTSKMLEITSR